MLNLKEAYNSAIDFVTEKVAQIRRDTQVNEDIQVNEDTQVNKTLDDGSRKSDMQVIITI